MVEALPIGSEEIASWSSDNLNLSRFMAPNGILWPTPPARPVLGAPDVHVWAVDIDPSPEALPALAAILSEEERARATRFRFERHRNRFIAGRGVLRSILGAYLDCPLAQLHFEYGANGKPALSGRFAASGLFFNFAHSEDLALIAVTRLGPIGVDVEQVRPIADADKLVERFFSPRENILFRTLPDDQKNAAFFNLWTRKEAWLKATGEGIAHSLNRVEVTFLPGEPVRLLALPEGSESGARWQIRELQPARSFVGAIALPNLPSSVCNFQFSIPKPL
jgi:4'-phosphopantetheinyl transferase